MPDLNQALEITHLQTDLAEMPKALVFKESLRSRTIITSLGQGEYDFDLRQTKDSVVTYKMSQS